MGLLVGAAWIVQAPGRPILGLLGLLPLVIVALAVNVWGVRARVPLLRSKNPILAMAGWGLIGVLLLSSEFFVLSGANLSFSAGHQSQASLASPPSAASAAPSGAAAPPSTSVAPSTSSAAAPPPAQPPASTAQPAPPPAAAPAQASAPAAGPLAPALSFLAPALTLLDPSLAADLGLREPQNKASCTRSSGTTHGDHGGGTQLSWASGATNGGAATWNLMQGQQCKNGGAH
jgi:hypothetical protein